MKLRAIRIRNVLAPIVAPIVAVSLAVTPALGMSAAEPAPTFAEAAREAGAAAAPLVFPSDVVRQDQADDDDRQSNQSGTQNGRSKAPWIVAGVLVLVVGGVFLFADSFGDDFVDAVDGATTPDR